MSALAALLEEVDKATPLEVFQTRCWARARLYQAGQIDLHTAVDKLQFDAMSQGLVAEIGQDEAQRLIALAFRESENGSAT